MATHPTNIITGTEAFVSALQTFLAVWGRFRTAELDHGEKHIHINVLFALLVPRVQRRRNLET